MDVVLGETNLTGKRADRGETNIFYYKSQPQKAASVKQSSPARSEETFSLVLLILLPTKAQWQGSGNVILPKGRILYILLNRQILT